MSSYISGNHVYEQVAPNTWLVSLNFTPRSAGSTTGKTFKEQLDGAAGDDANAAPTDVESLTEEQRDALLERLHNGQGDLTLQEWDDFLADLVDLGMITNNQRMHANGILCSFSDSISQSGATGSGVSMRHHSDSIFHMIDSWDGDPLRWLDDMNLFLLKEIRYAELDGYGTAGLSSQRSDCSDIAEIVRELLDGSRAR